MDINVAKLEKWVAVTVCVGIVGFGFYLAYAVFFTGPKVESSPTLAGVNASLFGPKIQKAAASLTESNKKILLKKKNLEFTETTLYKSFQDLPIDVPLSDSRGRPDPFVPYASP